MNCTPISVVYTCTWERELLLINESPSNINFMNCVDQSQGSKGQTKWQTGPIFHIGPDKKWWFGLIRLIWGLFWWYLITMHTDQITISYVWIIEPRCFIWGACPSQIPKLSKILTIPYKSVLFFLITIQFNWNNKKFDNLHTCNNPRVYKSWSDMP